MNLRIDPDELRPLVQAVVEEVLASIGTDEARLPSGRLGYPEAEAAALLGLKPHVLRDARLRGEITGSLLGKRYVYSRDDLLAWMRRQRVER